MLFPTPAVGDPPLAVLLTTSGGLVGGDRLDIDIRLAEGAAAHVTASAAEKVYRSIGANDGDPPVAVRSLRVPRWSFCRSKRSCSKARACGAKRPWSLVEMPGFSAVIFVVFGRARAAKRFTRGFLREVWQVRREGNLVWGDAVHLEDDIAQIIDHPACFDGAAAFATLILAPSGRDPRSFLTVPRAIQSTGAAEGLRSGVTAIAGLVVARWLAADATALRRAYYRSGLSFSSSRNGVAATDAATVECLARLEIIDPEDSHRDRRH